MDKEKIQTLIDQQRTNLADVEYLDLDSVAKVVENFENPKISDENVSDKGVMFRDGDMGLDETITQMKVAVSQANADNWQAKQEAIAAIGGNLNKLRQTMARQRA